MSRKQKLELTWVGKSSERKLEPRILLLEETYPNIISAQTKNDLYDNSLIQGDNLLALKALEESFADKVKCIYIDPPFNTKQALENYDDGLEHSIWLSLMKDRLVLLRALLAESGTIFIHIDDNELAYLTVLADEVFGRSNRRYVITFKQGSATGHKAINPGCVSTTNFILIYSKSVEHWKPNRVFTDRERDSRYGQYIANRDAHWSEWQFITLFEAFSRKQQIDPRAARKLIRDNPERLDEFVVENAPSVIQWARPDYDSVSKVARLTIEQSQRDTQKMFRLVRDGYSDMYLRNGQRILFYSDKLKMIDGRPVAGEPLTTLWDDILSNNIHKEGSVDFPKGKKPEALVKRCIELSTVEGDWVLDSFAGSGTTGAVAHKMRRRWIMVEAGEQATTHIVPRLCRVIGGEDCEGVTKSVGWTSGGGFRLFRLAPSLLEKDRWGNWIISKEYNPVMLARAMCKHMCFTYAPSQITLEYWNHGFSSERDFIYVTTQALTYSMLKALSHDVGPDRHLLICCKAFSGKADEFSNLSIRRIPQSVLANCEWARDDYSLRVTNMPTPESTVEEPAPKRVSQPARGDRKAASDRAPGLFNQPAETDA